MLIIASYWVTPTRHEWELNGMFEVLGVIGMCCDVHISKELSLFKGPSQDGLV